MWLVLFITLLVSVEQIRQLAVRQMLLTHNKVAMLQQQQAHQMQQQQQHKAPQVHSGKRSLSPPSLSLSVSLSVSLSLSPCLSLSSLSSRGGAFLSSVNNFQTTSLIPASVQKNMKSLSMNEGRDDRQQMSGVGGGAHDGELLIVVCGTILVERGGGQWAGPNFKIFTVCYLPNIFFQHRLLTGTTNNSCTREKERDRQRERQREKMIYCQLFVQHQRFRRAQQQRQSGGGDAQAVVAGLLPRDDAGDAGRPADGRVEGNAPTAPATPAAAATTTATPASDAAQCRAPGLSAAADDARYVFCTFSLTLVLLLEN